MTRTKKKASPVVSPAQFSENWKILQSQLSAAKSLVDASKPEASSSSTKSAKKRKRRMKTAAKVKSDKCIDQTQVKSTSTSTVRAGPLSLDCEFVGVGVDGAQNMLARVSMVDSNGDCVMDTFVRPDQLVVDWRTSVSGVRAANVKDAPEFTTVQQQVKQLLEGRLLIGHGLSNDLKVLQIRHPRAQIRDTAKFSLFRKMTGAKGTPSLKKLAHDILGVQTQQNEHDSVQDARVAMRLYMMYRQQWKRELFTDRTHRNALATSSNKQKNQS